MTGLLRPRLLRPCSMPIRRRAASSALWRRIPPALGPLRVGCGSSLNRSARRKTAVRGRPLDNRRPRASDSAKRIRCPLRRKAARCDVPSFAYSSSVRNTPVRFEVWCKRNLVTDSSCNGGGRTQRSDGRRRDRQVTRPSFAPILGVCEHDAAPRALVEIGRTERAQVVPRDDSPVARRAAHAAAMDGKTLAHAAGYLYSIIADRDSPPPEALVDGAAGCEVSPQRIAGCRREDSTCDRASPSPSCC
jgi:hypothetical protein